MPKAKAKGGPPPKSKAKPQAKWSERQARARVERLLSFSVVQQWRTVGRSCSVDAPVDWNALDSVVYVTGGSGGVLLLRFSTGGTMHQLMCLKPQRLEAKGELLASFLADALEVPTARLRVLPVSDEILSRLGRANLAIDDHRVYVDRILAQLADAKCLGLVEFVEGPIMEGQDFTQHLPQEVAASRFWVEVGRLAAFDCLINNLDRLPLIWENPGNLKNLMVDLAGKPRVVGIDQAAREIRTDAGLAKYISTLRELLWAVWGAEEDWPRSIFFQRIRSAIEVNFQGEFHVDPSSFKRGLQQAFQLFAWRWPSDLSQCLDESLEEVARVFNCRVVELDMLRRLVQATASTIAEEVQKMEMNSGVPKPMQDSFRKLLPKGLFGKEQLALLLHLLDSELDMSRCKVFLEQCFPEAEDISCPEFLRLLFRSSSEG